MPVWPNSSPPASPKRRPARSPPPRHTGTDFPSSFRPSAARAGIHNHYRLRRRHSPSRTSFLVAMDSGFAPTKSAVADLDIQKNRSRINRDRLRPGMTASHRLEPGEHVFDDIVGMFEADREPH